MNFKSPGLSFTGRIQENSKSPLQMRPNFGGVTPNNVSSVRTLSTQLNSTVKSDVNQMHHAPANPLNVQVSYNNYQSRPSMANPLQTTFVLQSQKGPMPQAPVPIKNFQTANPGLFRQNNGSMSQNQLPFARQSQTSNVHNFQTSPVNGPKAMITPSPFDVVPKETNISVTSPGSEVREISRFQSQLGGVVRQPDLNDNYSHLSKMSTNSRNHILRPISVNNEDHLMNLSGKEEALKNQNILIVNNFLQTLESSKRNVLRNMAENFRSRVNEIWTSYLNEQMRSNPGYLDIALLNGDVELIKQAFFEYLVSKTESYVEELKTGVFKEVFGELESVNSKKQYLDDKVRELIENSYNEVKRKNAGLRDQMRESKNANKMLIQQTIEKYDKLRETHMDMYDREFAFKLNGDPHLVKNTLRNALGFLHEENKKAESRLQQTRSQGMNSLLTLQNEIAFLENEAKFYQH